MNWPFNFIGYTSGFYRILVIGRYSWGLIFWYMGWGWGIGFLIYCAKLRGTAPALPCTKHRAKLKGTAPALPCARGVPFILNIKKPRLGAGV
jgi:hypothetical protein